MKQRLFLTVLILLSWVSPAYAGDPSVVVFSPQHTVKDVRQVRASFSDQMVPFGDPRLVEPFTLSCAEPGSGRWADGKNWVYDFERKLPAGVRCTFTLKSGLKSLAGKKLGGKRTFSFSTGGPAIRSSRPYRGSRIDEEQIFILTLDAKSKEKTVTANVYCSIEGINEQVGVRVLKGKQRKRLLRAARYRKDDVPRIVLQCKRSFPNDAKVRLVWGAGVAAMSGVPTEQDQVYTFKARPAFTASFTCRRENKRADCVPLLPLSVEFSAPVPWKYARMARLRGPKGKITKPTPITGGEEGKPEYVRSIAFEGLFPERTPFTVELPKNMKDDAGRALANRDKFPLVVRTDEYSPLAKFAAPFGIIELNGDAMLPVTLRNLEPEVTTRMLKVGKKDVRKKGLLEATRSLGKSIGSFLSGSSKGDDEKKGAKGAIPGKIHRTGDEEQIIEWFRTLRRSGPKKSVLKGVSTVKDFSLTKPNGPKAFEVVGIPMKKPGFYVVELESDALGASLRGSFLGITRSLYVSTAALVTNLSAHFKQGRESSLVWVTTLDKAKPVNNASVALRDCRGELVWEGSTNKQGIARIAKDLSLLDMDYSSCKGEPGFFVFARTKNDMTFVRSGWNEGIEGWRFGLPGASYRGPVIGHTIFDRSLLRAGEIIHMKHVIRKHGMSGFSPVKEVPEAVLIRHRGSNQRYEYPLKWDNKGLSETTWKIPKDARLGHYEVILVKKATPKKHRASGEGRFGGSRRADGWPSGSFQVEEFRVPLMKASIQPPKKPLVNASSAEVDLLVTYLSGGGAGDAPVKLRSQVAPKAATHFGAFDGFTFANGTVKAGVMRRSSYGSYEDDGDRGKKGAQTYNLVLDKAGALRARIPDLPKITKPHTLQAELEFRDPNGEVQTVSSSIPLWPSKVLVGIKPDSWAASKKSFTFHVAAVGINGKPVPNAAVTVDLFQRSFYTHRKRLVGGFYSYEHVSETKRVGSLCEGTTNARGLLICTKQSPVSGNVVLLARTKDSAGNVSTAHRSVWVAGKGDWWFDVTDSDRIDLLPEKKRYEPGERARFQVRMPFRRATVLVTVEREGVMETFVRNVSGKNPTIELPVRNNYAPNVFVSALCIRGRVSGVKPTAIVDLGRPAFKLGIAEINVGWKAHELKVAVSTKRKVFRIREKAGVRVKVRRADGSLPPRGSEVAIAVVDAGLLQLKPNTSWNLLEAMMGRRGHEVHTASAQSQVIGKRHYGLKALVHGGGGGKRVTRELFDTLLLWKGRVRLNQRGEANVVVPLNDSLTSFRIVAVANGGVGRFGTGATSIRTTQDVMLLSGVPPLVREGDRFQAGFTVRNGSDRTMKVDLSATATTVAGTGKGAALPGKPLAGQSVTLSPGAAKEIKWELEVPAGAETMTWQVEARDRAKKGGDRLKVTQKVVAAVPVRTYQATIKQVRKKFTIDVKKPDDALLDRGGVNVSFRPRIADGLSGVVQYMQDYPYTCMEQKISRSIALRDKKLWDKNMDELPSYMDSNGLVKYFPSPFTRGSDTLTAYILSIADEAGWKIPRRLQSGMENGLKKFIRGSIFRRMFLPVADLSLRKLTAMEALSRSGKAKPNMLDSITLEPNLWPTSAVIDWINVLTRVKKIPKGEKRLKEARQILRSRLTFQGTGMLFSTERRDNLWWLMVSGDVNAAKTILAFLSVNTWNEDMPRLVKGALSRQKQGHWNTTVANAWGVLAMEKFSKKFESIPVSGSTSVTMRKKSKAVAWKQTPKGKSLLFGWSGDKDTVAVAHKGTGRPWATIQSLTAIPLKKPISSGYKIKKTIKAIDQKKKGRWTRGDVARVTLELEAQTDMTWVVVSDPVPAGSSILGKGLGGESRILAKGEKRKGWVWPAFAERSFEAFRAYYEYVPKGKWTVEYTMRLNNEGLFHLPQTRVEALYMPEMFGEIPNKTVTVQP